MNLIKIEENCSQNMQSCELQKLNNDEKQKITQQKIKKKNEENKIGHWSQKENIKYYAFIKRFENKFNKKSLRREYKVFKTMSQFIKSRNANQCRSHHHKMQKNKSKIQDLLQFLRNKNPSFQKKSFKYIQQLQQLQNINFTKQNNNNTNKTAQQNNQIQDDKLIPKYFYQTHQQNQHQGVSQKKFDIGNLKTGLNQDDAQNILNYEPRQCYFGPQDKKFELFPSMQHLHTFSIPHQLEDRNLPSLQYPHYLNYQHELLQCQQLFFQWYNKLSNLIYEQEQGVLTNASISMDEGKMGNF